MKRKRIHFEEPIGDREQFKPQMLITLENQILSSNLGSDVNPISEGTSVPTIQKSSMIQPLQKNYLPSHSRPDSLMSQRVFSCTLSTPDFIEKTDRDFKKSLKKTKRSSITEKVGLEEISQCGLQKKKSRLQKKVDQLKQKNSDRMYQPGLFANTSYLDKTIKQERRKNIVKNFIKKIRKDKVDDRYMMKLNEVEPPPSFFSIEGIELPQNIELLLKIFQIFFTFLLIFLNSIQLVFHNILVQEIFIIKVCSTVFFTFELIFSLITVKKVEGRVFSQLNQIWQYLGLEKILIDFGGILIIVLDISIESQAMTFLRLFILAKVPEMLKNLQQVEVKLISSNENDKYWSLVKVLLFNFCFSHILAIVLKGMVQSRQINWMQVKGIQNAQWFEQYIWSYYWGTNIMLTVGFGDISASNYREALCLIFIQTFSCIVLAYNVNCVGELIMKIRSRDEQKKKQMKVFKKISDNSPISNQLNWKITNYIEESINLKKNFDLDDEHEFVKNLPEYLKEEFLKQTHRNVFHQLPFFTFLMEKTIYNLAQNIEMKMCHPEETIRNLTDDFHLWIMRSGKVGVGCHKSDSILGGKIMDQIEVKEGGAPFILSLNFITKKHLPFEFKSLQYSSFYFMKFSNLINALRQLDSDYQYYSFMRDKHNSLPDQFQSKKCPNCKDHFHYLMQCPAIHFIPNIDKIVLQYLRAVKFGKNSGRMYKIRNNYTVQALEIYRYYKFKEKEPSDLSHYSNYSNSLLGQEIKRPLTPKSERDLVCEDDVSSQIWPKRWKSHPYEDTYKDLKEFIRGQVEKLRLVQDYADPIWLIQSDVMTDYSKYFPECNPSNINLKTSMIRTKRKNQSK